MAIVKCPECGRAVSNKAPICPNCGYGVEAYYTQIELEKEQQARELSEAKRKRIIKGTIIAVIILSVIGVTSGAGYWYWKTNYYYSPEELARIEKVIKQIDQAPNVIVGKATNIERVQKAYDSLTDREKLKVTNYQLLVDTTVQIEAEEKAKREEKVQDAIARIDAIGEVAFDRSTNDRIETAKKALELVAEEDLERVTNQNILVQAQEKYEPLRKQLQDSKSNYYFAQSYEKAQKYQEAIGWYEKVIPEDEDYYDLSQKKIVELEAKIKADKQAQAAAQAKVQQEAAAKAQAQAEAQAAQQKAQNDKYYPTVASVMEAFQSHFGLKMSKVTEVRCNKAVTVITVKAGSVQYVGTDLSNNPSGLDGAIVEEYDSSTGYHVYQFKLTSGGVLPEMREKTMNTIFDMMRTTTTIAIDLKTLEGYM